VDDVKRMIIEQNISYWVQLAPNNISDFYLHGKYTVGKGSCGVFPLEFFVDTTSPYSSGVSNFHVITDQTALETQSYVELSYTLTAYTKLLPDGKKRTIFIEPSNLEETLSSEESPVISENVLTDSSHTSGKGGGVTSEGLRGSESSEWVKIVRHVNHIWYHHWEDFKVPPAEDEPVSTFYVFAFAFALSVAANVKTKA
jgi:hypothetical protein